MSANSAGTVKATVQDDLNNRIPAIGGKLFGPANKIAGSVVNKNVDPTEFGYRTFHQGIDLHRVPNVGWYCQYRYSITLQRALSCGQVIHVSAS
tara:strand:+ start:613 stop:894 length:282 start_codon:yes stop_codon:yes gene_type:complete